MNIFVTLHKGEDWDLHFPEGAIKELEKLGKVTYNNTGRPLTEDEFIACLKDADICVSHWCCPKFTERVLSNAPKLKMIAHAAGSVGYMVTDQVYERGIIVCSANNVMAEYVAESVLAYMLAGLLLIPQQNNDLKSGILWNKRSAQVNSLIGKKVGLIGLGAVGMNLLKFLEPFNVSIKVYDPYLSPAALEKHGHIQLGSIEEVVSWGDIVSIHASMTPETHHMIDGKILKLVRNGALFLNTARGPIVDEAALVEELQSGRFAAVLDVYEKQPLPLESLLRKLENVIIMPHMAGTSVREKMTHAMIDEIKRFQKGGPLMNRIPFEKYRLMTQWDT